MWERARAAEDVGWCPACGHVDAYVVRDDRDWLARPIDEDAEALRDDRADDGDELAPGEADDAWGAGDDGDDDSDGDDDDDDSDDELRCAECDALLPVVPRETLSVAEQAWLDGYIDWKRHVRAELLRARTVDTALGAWVATGDRRPGGDPPFLLPSAALVAAVPGIADRATMLELLASDKSLRDGDEVIPLPIQFDGPGPTRVTLADPGPLEVLAPVLRAGHPAVLRGLGALRVAHVDHQDYQGAIVYLTLAAPLLDAYYDE